MERRSSKVAIICHIPGHLSYFPVNFEGLQEKEHKFVRSVIQSLNLVSKSMENVDFGLNDAALDGIAKVAGYIHQSKIALGVDCNLVILKFTLQAKS